MCGEYLGGYVAQHLVTAEVVNVFGVGEAVLGDGLEALDPAEPPVFVGIPVGVGPHAGTSERSPALMRMGDMPCTRLW